MKNARLSPTATLPADNSVSPFPLHETHAQHEIKVSEVPVLPRSAARSVAIVLTTTYAMILSISNNTSVSIALPTIGRELNVSPARLQWITSAYPLSSGCLLLLFGRVADLYGRKKTFCCGTALLAALTLGCGFANNVKTLAILRGIQGIGAAATIPASLGILAFAFPPSRARSFAFASFAAGAPLGAIIGTVIGGVLTEYTAKTWRAPMYLQSGLSVLCLIGGLLFFDGDVRSAEADRRIDWIGALLITAGLVLVVFVLGDGEIAPQGWATSYIIACLVLGVILVLAFVFWQQYLERIQDDLGRKHSWLKPPPLVKMSLWKRAHGGYAVIMAVAFLNWGAFLSWTYWVQLYYQDYKNYSPMQTVVRLLPMFVSGILCNLSVGILAALVPLVYFLGIGTAATSLACILFAVIVPSTTYWAFGFPAAVIAVMGSDFVYAAGTLYVARISLPHEQSVSAALFQTMTQLGSAVGITVTTIVFNRVTRQRPDGQDQLKSYQAAEWTASAFGICGALLSVLWFRGVGVVGHRNFKSAPPDV